MSKKLDKFPGFIEGDYALISWDIEVLNVYLGILKKERKKFNKNHKLPPNLRIELFNICCDLSHYVMGKEVAESGESDSCEEKRPRKKKKSPKKRELDLSESSSDSSPEPTVASTSQKSNFIC